MIKLHKVVAVIKSERDVYIAESKHINHSLAACQIHPLQG